jgi:hypothetical protein
MLPLARLARPGETPHQWIGAKKCGSTWRESTIHTLSAHGLEYLYFLGWSYRNRRFGPHSQKCRLEVSTYTAARRAWKFRNREHIRAYKRARRAAGKDR